jgi:PKD repeat protein
LLDETEAIEAYDAVVFGPYVYVAAGRNGLCVASRQCDIVAEFEAEPWSGNGEVQFYDQTWGEVWNWNWSFGNGDVSTEQNPFYVYPESGIYTVSLTVYGPDGDDTIVKPDCIHVDTATSAQEEIPKQYELFPCAPNPFNPSTTIRFSLPEATEVTLAIYDLSGMEVLNLAKGDYPAGNHVVTWRGMDSQGTAQASGIYFYRLEAGGFIQTRKMTLLK